MPPDHCVLGSTLLDRGAPRQKNLGPDGLQIFDFDSRSTTGAPSGQDAAFFLKSVGFFFGISRFFIFLSKIIKAKKTRGRIEKKNQRSEGQARGPVGPLVKSSCKSVTKTENGKSYKNFFGKIYEKIFWV
jgi:hypothetical protein